MDTDERKIEHRLGHEVAVADRVEAVVEHSGEAQVCSVADRVDRQRRTSEGAGAERRHVEANASGEEPVDVTGKRPPVGKQMVSQQYRLRPLEMRVAR